MTLMLGAEPEPELSPASAAPARLIGVEEELLLVDAETLRPRPAAGEILRTGRLALLGGSHLEAEVKSEQIEIVSPPLSNHADLLAAILAGRRAADAHARRSGARAVALATAVDACETHLVPVPRYERMQRRFGLTIDEQLTCGFHVHVTIDSPQEGVAVLDRIRPWLPVLLALSANSPYWHGVDTRFDSYRYQAWSRWPSAGAYDLFGTAEGYAAALDRILAQDVSLDAGMIYFDARLSTHAPTVEIRIADVCLRPHDAAWLAVLVRALVERAAADATAGRPPDGTATTLLRIASWRASRWGLSDRLISPVTGCPIPAADAVGELLAHVDAHFASAEERRVIRRGIAAVLRRGNGATQQRRIRAAGGEEAIVPGALALVDDDPDR